MTTTLLFFFFSISFVTLGTYACAVKRSVMYAVLAIMILSLLFEEQTNITFLSQEWYKTATWGFNVTLSDLGALVLLFSMMFRPHEFKIRVFLPLTVPFFLLFIVGIISFIANINVILPNSNYLLVENQPGYYPLHLFPLFECWKILRFYFTYWILANFLTSKWGYDTVIKSFCVMVFFLTCKGLYQRYILHQHAIGAGFHARVLGTFAGMIGCFIFPFAFYFERIFEKIKFLFVTMCSLLLIILTFGKSALLGFLGVAFITYLFVIKNHFNMRNMLISLSGLIVAFVFFLISFDTLSQQFSNISMVFTRRKVVYDFALQLGKENFFGVGLGNFTAWSNFYEYFDIAHNIFLLNLAEIGILGFVVFIFLYLRVLQMSIFAFMWTKENQLLRMILIGSTASFVYLVLQDMVHFTSRINVIALLQLIMFAGISRIYMDAKDMRNVVINSEEERQFQSCTVSD